jgi:hypothetical protein
MVKKRSNVTHNRNFSLVVQRLCLDDRRVQDVCTVRAQCSDERLRFRDTPRDDNAPMG